MGDPEVAIFADLFTEYLNDTTCSTSPTFWHRCIVALIPKEQHARVLDRSRPISLVFDIQKWYFKSILLTFEHQLQLVYSETYGFVAGQQCAEITFPIKLLIDKSIEFDEEFYIIQCDVKSAFDNIDHHRLHAAFNKLHTPALFQHAVFIELNNTQLRFVLQGMCSEDVASELGGRQGAVETPTLWRMLLDAELAPLIQRWHQAYFGVSVDDIHLTHLIWADDTLLFGKTLQQSQAMLDYFVALLADAGSRCCYQ